MAFHMRGDACIDVAYYKSELRKAMYLYYAFCDFTVCSWYRELGCSAWCRVSL
jgi:hypothetical protein